MEGDADIEDEFNRMMQCMMSSISDSKKSEPIPRIINLFILVDSYHLPVSSVEKQVIKTYITYDILKIYKFIYILIPQLLLLNRIPNWQPRAKVILFWPWEMSYKSLNYILSLLAKFHITKILLIVKPTNEEILYLYSWDDYYQTKSKKCKRT